VSESSGSNKFKLLDFERLLFLFSFAEGFELEYVPFAHHDVLAMGPKVFKIALLLETIKTIFVGFVLLFNGFDRTLDLSVE